MKTNKIIDIIGWILGLLAFVFFVGGLVGAAIWKYEAAWGLLIGLVLAYVSVQFLGRHDKGDIE